MESRYFDEWDMRLVDLYELSKYPREFFAAKYRYRSLIEQQKDNLADGRPSQIGTRHPVSMTCGCEAEPR